MKHKIIKILTVALLSAVSVCSCEKDPVPTGDVKDGNQRDSTDTVQSTMQPWVDSGKIILYF